MPDIKQCRYHAHEHSMYTTDSIPSKVMRCTPAHPGDVVIGDDLVRVGHQAVITEECPAFERKTHVSADPEGYMHIGQQV